MKSKISYRLICALACTSVVSLCAACESAEDVLEEFRSRAEVKLDAMRKATKAAVDNQVKARPKLPEKLHFDGDAQNAYFVHPHWLDPDKQIEKDILTTASDVMSVRSLLKGTQAAQGNPKAYRRKFERFLGARWLVVVETIYFNPGSTAGDSSFHGGAWRGTLHFVDLEEGRSVGSLEIKSEHSDTVKAIEGNEQEHLSSDVWMRAREAINEALVPFMPAEHEPL